MDASSSDGSFDAAPISFGHSCYHFWFITVKEGDLLHAWQGDREEGCGKAWEEALKREQRQKLREEKRRARAAKIQEKKDERAAQTRTQTVIQRGYAPRSPTSSGIHLAEVCER